MAQRFSYEHGLIALITVLVISAVTIFIAVGTNLLGVDEAKIGLGRENSAEALYLATACAEEAFLRLKTDFTYTNASPETVAVDGKNCTLVSILGSSAKEIHAEASEAGKVRRLKITVTKPSTKLVVNSWEEVGDF